MLTLLLLVLTTALGIAIANVFGGMLVIGAILGFCVGLLIRYGATGDIDFGDGDFAGGDSGGDGGSD